MMQRKNKSKPASTTNNNGYGSGYDSSNNSDNNNTNNGNDRLTRSSPSKPPAPPHSGGLSIGALTGHHTSLNATNNATTTITNSSYERKPSKSSSSHATKKNVAVAMATVKRNQCGTQPFDKHWLNLDCCGLICATLTYMLHLYGVYSFGWILLPPWFSVMDEDGYRELTFGCHFHRTLFITIALLAVYSHFKAMTTDPGAVPPDANPLPDPDTEAQQLKMQQQQQQQQNLDELDNLIKGEKPSSSPTHNGNGSIHVSSSPGRASKQHTSSLMQEDNSFGSDNNSNGLLNGSSNNGNGNSNGHGLPQAMATTAGALGAAAVVGAAGAAAVVGGAAAVGAANLASAAAPTRPVQQQPQRGRRMCRRCQAYKPPRAHHCSICKRCIIKMDHHCPWVNNCVGIGNHKYFLLFIFYTSLSCSYSFLFLIYRFFHCIGHSSYHRGPRCVDHPTDLLPLVGLTVEALLFGLFTLCMMVDQWDVVMTNLTHIDRLKGESHLNHHHPHDHRYPQQHPGAYAKLPQHYNQHVGSGARNLISSAREGINEVFGSRFNYTWLSPLHKVCFPETVQNDIFGYCRPCSTSAAGGMIAEGARRINKSMEMVGRGGAGGDGMGRGGISGAEIV